MELIKWKIDGQWSVFKTYRFWWNDEDTAYLYLLQWGNSLTRRIILYQTNKDNIMSIDCFLRWNCYQGVIESDIFWEMSLNDVVLPLSTDPVAFLAELVL